MRDVARDDRSIRELEGQLDAARVRHSGQVRVPGEYEIETFQLGLFPTLNDAVGEVDAAHSLMIGGRRVAVFLFAAVLGLLAQMVLGSLAAKSMGLPALFGVIPGAVSLTGGPATALAFGPVFEKAGIAGATAVGLASAVFGIVVNGLLSGFVGGFLVQRHALQPDPSESAVRPVLDVDAGRKEKHGSVLEHMIAMGVAMSLGSLVSAQLAAWGLTLPA